MLKFPRKEEGKRKKKRNKGENNGKKGREERERKERRLRDRAEWYIGKKMKACKKK